MEFLVTDEGRGVRTLSGDYSTMTVPLMEL
jgi:hypothetical protein